MWWLAIPAVGLIGKAIYNAISDDNSEKPAVWVAPSVLERNLQRLEDVLTRENRKKIAIIGQAGSGKSSILKALLPCEVRPEITVGIQTDATDWSMNPSCDLVYKDAGKVFVDVPGYDTKKHPLDVFLDGFPFRQFDLLLFVMKGKIRGADERMLLRAKADCKKVILVRSFCDSLASEDMSTVTKDLGSKLFKALDCERLEKNLSLTRKQLNLSFVSCKTQRGIEHLRREVMRL